MAIDPRMYEKYSGKKGDPSMRMGAALAQNDKAKQERDEMPKGVSGGMRTMAGPGWFMQIFYAIKDRFRTK
jgi:hypothetical protein